MICYKTKNKNEESVCARASDLVEQQRDADSPRDRISSYRFPKVTSPFSGFHDLNLENSCNNNNYNYTFVSTFQFQSEREKDINVLVLPRILFL